MTSTARRVALVAWIVLAVLTGGSLLAGPLFPAWIGAILLLPALSAWVVLLVVYHRLLAGWGAILLLWAAFGLLRAGAAWLGAGDGILRSVVVTLLLVLCLYALIAGYAALIALVIRRDVSVAYIFLPTAIGALVMLLTVQAAGGVAQWFETLASPSTVGRSLTLEPLLLNLSCMGTLGFIAAVPHMIITVVREMRGN